MIQVLPLLATAALVGVLHMSAPDHWVTICVLGQASKWSRARLMGFGVATASGHVALSLLLGFGVLGAGLLFSKSASTDLTLATGAAMVVGGLAYGAWTLRPRDRGGNQNAEEGEEAKGRGIGYFAVLGAALSPDLSILPIFLLAVNVGFGLAIETSVVFAAASILSLTVLVLAGSMGLAKVLSRAPEKYNDAMVGFIIAVAGAYVLFFG